MPGKVQRKKRSNQDSDNRRLRLRRWLSTHEHCGAWQRATQKKYFQITIIIFALYQQHKMTEATYSNFDAMFEKGEHEEAYKQLMESYKNGNEDNVAILWRLARALYFLSVDDKKKHKDLMYEGQKFAIHGHEKDPQNFECLRWAAIITGSISDISGNKEKIQQGNLFKELLDKALAINPDEYTLQHLSGRLAFAVSSLSWVERTLASTLFGSPPEATMDEAIEKFAKVKELKPDWIENILYYVKSMISKDAKGKKQEISIELKEAVSMTAVNSADRNALEEVKVLAKKYVK